MATRGENTRPIIIRKIKKVAGGHHGGAWKVAYADFVTAMMAFFMLLWLISNPDKQRLKGLAEYFSASSPSAQGAAASGDTPGEAIGSGGQAQSQNTPKAATAAARTARAASQGTTQGGTATIPSASMRVLAQEMRIAIDSDPDAATRAATKLDEDQQGLRITLTDTEKRPMFRGGTADLNDYARALLARVAMKLAKSGSQIAIEGHTDGSGGQSEANWRLSGERALAARSAMIAAGLTPDRFAEIVAKGASEPVYIDQPDRAENRRITIIALGAASSTPADASFRF